ncbi:MAG: hypothetical protein ACQCXQ_01985 [Verrucomicrobiales bacterium]|nr:hypothetical protein [Verrucomicrobiota bacterium JB025]
MKKLLARCLAVGVLVFAGCGLVFAQDSSDDDGITDDARKDKLWIANVGGGEYMVRLSAIQAISRHQYVLDGAVIVDEVTVDASGQALVRFYHIEPITEGMSGSSAGKVASNVVRRGRELADKAAGRAGVNVQDMVVKKYPETTHARTIEYRVTSEQELVSLLTSVKKAWMTGRGRTFTIKQE